MSTKILSPSNRLSKHYAQRVKQILIRFNDIRELIQHEGMKGSRVEQEVRKFLVEFLPELYQYSSGIVIDNTGEECDRSRQEDILVIDRFFNPKLFLDEEPSIYPVEVVYCGIEVKTSVDSNELKKAIDNISSLKSLKFIQEDITYTKGGMLNFGKTKAPYGIIFCFDTSMKSVETLLKHFIDFTSNIEPSSWPDLLCILNRGIITIGKNKKPIFQLYGLLEKDSSEQIKAITVDAVDEVNIQGQLYPTIILENEYYPVDVARTFTVFLSFLYDFLLSKVIMANSNLLRHYMPSQMYKSLALTVREDNDPEN